MLYVGLNLEQANNFLRASYEYGTAREDVFIRLRRQEKNLANSEIFMFEDSDRGIPCLRVDFGQCSAISDKYEEHKFYVREQEYLKVNAHRKFHMTDGSDWSFEDLYDTFEYSGLDKSAFNYSFEEFLQHIFTGCYPFCGQLFEIDAEINPLLKGVRR